MSNSSPAIRNLQELRARKFQLKKEILLSQQSAKASVTPTKNKAKALAFSTLAPVAAVGVGLFAASKLFGRNKREVELTPEQLALIRNQRANESQAVNQQAAAPTTSSTFTSIVRALLPFIKAGLPLLQSAFATYQATRAASISETAREKAETAATDSAE